jgi:hypothetical protein
MHCHSNSTTSESGQADALDEQSSDSSGSGLLELLHFGLPFSLS